MHEQTTTLINSNTQWNVHHPSIGFLLLILLGGGVYLSSGGERQKHPDLEIEPRTILL